MGKLLVVSDNINGFFAGSIISELQMMGMDIIVASLGDENIHDLIKESKAIYLLLSDEFDANSIFFKSFRKKWSDYNRKIIVYSNKENVGKVQEVFPSYAITDSFVRPMDNALMVEKLTSALKNIEQSTRKKTILVVDDSGPMLRTILGWFEEKYNIILANSAGTAQIKLQDTIPDLILLDYEMPIISGPKFLKKLREDNRTKNIPVMFLTAKDDAESVKSVISLKPQGYILKTVSGTSAVEKVDAFFKN